MFCHFNPYLMVIRGNKEISSALFKPGISKYHLDSLTSSPFYSILKIRGMAWRKDYCIKVLLDSFFYACYLGIIIRFVDWC